LIEAAGNEDIIESERGSENDREKKNKARHPEPAVGRGGLLAGGALPGQLQVDQAQELIGISRFVLAVSVGIHRERILTNRPKHKWILNNRGQT
jgi:hypothetical protein